MERLQKIDEKLYRLYNKKLRIEFDRKGQVVVLMIDLKTGAVYDIATKHRCESDKSFARIVEVRIMVQFDEIFL